MIDRDRRAAVAAALRKLSRRGLDAEPAPGLPLIPGRKVTADTLTDDAAAATCLATSLAGRIEHGDDPAMLEVPGEPGAAVILARHLAVLAHTESDHLASSLLCAAHRAYSLVARQDQPQYYDEWTGTIEGGDWDPWTVQSLVGAGTLAPDHTLHAVGNAIAACAERAAVHLTLHGAIDDATDVQRDGVSAAVNALMFTAKMARSQAGARDVDALQQASGDGVTHVARTLSAIPDAHRFPVLERITDTLRDASAPPIPIKPEHVPALRALLPVARE